MACDIMMLMRWNFFLSFGKRRANPHVRKSSSLDEVTRLSFVFAILLTCGNFANAAHITVESVIETGYWTGGTPSAVSTITSNVEATPTVAKFPLQMAIQSSNVIANIEYDIVPLRYDSSLFEIRARFLDTWKGDTPVASAWHTSKPPRHAVTTHQRGIAFLSLDSNGIPSEAISGAILPVWRLTIGSGHSSASSFVYSQDLSLIDWNLCNIDYVSDREVDIPPDVIETHRAAGYLIDMATLRQMRDYITNDDPIKTIVARLSKAPCGMWPSGEAGRIDLPDTANIHKLIHRVFEITGLDSGHVTQTVIRCIREVSIGSNFPCPIPARKYTAVFLDTNLGEKIILLNYQGSSVGWVCEVFDARKEMR